ncbi:MAG TPA: helix-turn-helix domain-containing protein [Dictyobacter sp.]|jgi:DNA-binding HxlR family transcriptional regulator|nr:helix-turn-helix domain-containing protein [Dictyobacter sp.]
MKVSDQANETQTRDACADPGTPLGRAIHLLGDSWVLLIIMNLLQGSMRFNTLRTALGHISSRTLSNRLKLLEELGFVQRKAFLEIPPRVEYHITEKGQALGDVIAALEKFGNKYLVEIPVAEGAECPLEEEEVSSEQSV